MPSKQEMDAMVARSEHELIAEFVAQADVSANTKQAYKRSLEEFACWLVHPKTQRREGGSGALVDARRADVVRFAAYLSAGERYAAGDHFRVRQVLSAASRKRFLGALRSFYLYLLSVDLVDADPTHGIKRPKVTVRPGKHLTAEEVRRLLAVRGEPRERMQTFLLVFTGARMNEIRTLTWQDVDFEVGTLRLLGKGDKYRIIDIHPRLMPELRRWRVHQQALAERDEVIAEALARPDRAFVLLSSTGRMLPEGTIHRQLKRRCARAGLYVLGMAHKEWRSEVTPHTLRRTFATILLNSGNPLDAVADVLGHESVDTTRRHYAFASDERRRQTIHSFEV